MLFQLLILLVIVPLSSAHGRITKITTSSGFVYPGWDPEFALAQIPPPPLAAWTSSNLGNIYIPPSHFSNSDIICHFDASPGALHINVSAGDTLKLQWNEWPTSHVGPMLTYMAERHDDVKKEKLKWVKIDELGWLNDTGWDELMLGGTWASNVLIANDFQWTVHIPEALAAGDYVLRHEIIALHVADEVDGAQAYPQCVNVRVTKGGEKKIRGGVLGTQLYGISDRGILVDVHEHIKGYEIPGSRVWSGATVAKQPNERR